jgi:hypothetical protein
VENLKRVGSGCEARPYPSAGKALKRRAFRLFETERGKRRREGAGKPVPRQAGNTLERRKTQESIGPPDPRVRIGIRILARRNALESRGIVILWSSEQKNAMSETTRGQRRRKACGFARGKSSAG